MTENSRRCIYINNVGNRKEFRFKIRFLTVIALLVIAIISVKPCFAADDADTVLYTYQDIDAIACVIYNEARGVKSDTEMACVAWTILNRVDAGYGSIIDVVSAKNQFAYSSVEHIPDEIYTIAADVIVRWSCEKSGEESVGRVLPKDYLWFFGDGTHNYFRNEYRSKSYWDYSLESPYKS